MEFKKGITTGTCAALAAAGAVKMALTGKLTDEAAVMTPSGVIVKEPLHERLINCKSASCAVKKYSGDDPDITDGVLVYAEVTLNESNEIKIDGGRGVGRVTKPGLQQKIGEAAINKVPLKMIRDAVSNEMEKYGAICGAKVIISIPQGEEIAKKTFNPGLGIEGGISVLGTSGIVEPMSERALIDTIKTEIKYKKANDGDSIMLAPGNYGIDFMRQSMGIDMDRAVKCSNFIGEALDCCADENFKNILLIGHIGKLSKLAAGVMNTHSKIADVRAEVFMANAAFVGADCGVIKQISECVSTDAMADVLKQCGLLRDTMKRITERAEFYVNKRIGGNVTSGIIMFSNVHGILGKTENVDILVKKFREDKNDIPYRNRNGQ